MCVSWEYFFLLIWQRTNYQFQQSTYRYVQTNKILLTLTVIVKLCEISDRGCKSSWSHSLVRLSWRVDCRAPSVPTGGTCRRQGGGRTSAGTPPPPPGTPALEGIGCHAVERENRTECRDHMTRRSAGHALAFWHHVALDLVQHGWDALFATDDWGEGDDEEVVGAELLIVGAAVGTIYGTGIKKKKIKVLLKIVANWILFWTSHRSGRGGIACTRLGPLQQQKKSNQC